MVLHRHQNILRRPRRSAASRLDYTARENRIEIDVTLWDMIERETMLRKFQCIIFLITGIDGASILIEEMDDQLRASPIVQFFDNRLKRFNVRVIEL